ncbi:MAG: hypothetical protein IJU70_04245 [Lentisphaeria bacterium]|nr:hypothetical protein [Lentisphaeria bacterium]
MFARGSALLAGTLLAGGCLSTSPPDAPPPPKRAEKKPVLADVTKTAIEKRVDTRVLESLQTIAREHVEKSRLLELPGMIYDLPRRLPELVIGNDFRLRVLDHALESCRILTCPAKTDLSKVQRPVEARKIALEQAVLWSKLDYVNRLKKAGFRSPDIETMRKDVTLELAISSGIPEKAIENFDFSSLPQPVPVPRPPRPDYVSQITSFYGGAPDAALRFADVVYRLPAELLRRSDSNFDAAFKLTLTAGTALKLDIVHPYLESAFKKFRSAEEKIRKSPSVPPALRVELEQARLDWRTAYFRMQYDRLPYPPAADKKELAFLKDLLSLQGK